MADARRGLLLAYLTLIRDRMRLQAWDLEVSKKPADDHDTVLAIVTNPARNAATVFVGSFFEEQPLEQRQTAVHELIHLVQANLLEYADSFTWRRAIAPDVAAAIGDRIRAEAEIQADFLARLLAPSLPMPPVWPDTDA